MNTKPSQTQQKCLTKNSIGLQYDVILTNLGKIKYFRFFF